MKVHLEICVIRSLTIGGLLLAMTAGCQRYERRPLDLEAHRAAWAQRDPAGQEIAAFAQRFSNGRADDAKPFDPLDGLSLAEAEVVALVFNPELRMARLRVSVAKASAQFAGLWEDPVFDLDVLRIVESVPEPWILATSLGFTIPLSGRLEAEKAKANAEFQAEIARAAQREWEIVNELRRAWTEWSATMLQAEVAAELENRLALIVSTTDRLEQVGELPLIESRLFQIEASNRASEARELSGQASQLELQIKAILGLRPESPVTLAISLDADANESESVEAELEQRSASLKVVRAEYEVAEQNLRTEIRKQYPDLTIGPAYENEEDQSRIGIGGSFPIPLLNRNRQGIAEAEAERELARASYETQYEQAIHELAQARGELAYRRQLREDFEVRVIPLVEAQVENARRMLELGEVDTLVQLESLIRLSEAKLRIVEIRLGEALAANRVTAIAGPRWDITVDARGAQ
jgi:outer membrane protein, heavy metal efflux system